jgi:hypothetical protein
LVQVTDKKYGTVKKWYQDKSEMAEAQKKFNFEIIEGKTQKLTFNQTFKYQDEELETRYKKFKDVRDKALQKQPDDKDKILVSIN